MGEVFAGRYELLEPIAEGGMGTVWTVRDLKRGEVRAAKVLRQSDAGSLMRFIREQSMRIDHAHVVTPESWAGEDDRILFTMPLVRGGSVATLVGDMGPLPASWVGELVDQTLQALSAVHAAGIVHRDVKPANLLLEPTGTGRPHLRLTDFGVAVPLGEPRMTRASQVFATPGYASGDQLRGADPDPRDDLFSVGTVGLELLSGVRPPGSLDAARTRATTEPDLVPLLELLARAADPDVERRPVSAERFRTDLRKLRLPPVRAGDGPMVFTHLEEDGTVSGAGPDESDHVDPAAPAPATYVEPPGPATTQPDAVDQPVTDDLRPLARPVLPPAVDLAPHAASGTVQGRGLRVAAATLLLVAAACVVGALLVLLG